jgi:hypothetical protein
MLDQVDNTSKIKFFVPWDIFDFVIPAERDFFAGFAQKPFEGGNLRPNSEIYVQKGTILSKIYIQGFF